MTGCSRKVTHVPNTHHRRFEFGSHDLRSGQYAINVRMTEASPAYTLRVYKLERQYCHDIIHGNADRHESPRCEPVEERHALRCCSDHDVGLGGLISANGLENWAKR